MKTTIARVLLLGTLIAATAGIALERGFSSFASTTPVTDRTSVWGDWQSADFGPFTTTNLSGNITWSVTGLPDNVSVDFGLNPGTTATATIEQAPGTRGPDVTRGPGPNFDVQPYSMVVEATDGDTTETFPITFTISPRPVSILGSFAVDNKTYDGNTTATISASGNTLSLQAYDPAVDLLSGVIDSDVSLAPVATFGSAAAGSRTADLQASTLVGAEAANYILRFVSAPTASGTIATKSLDLTFGSVSKVYNGLATVTVATPTLSGVIGSDQVGITGSPTWSFANKNVGVGKALSITSGAYSLTGDDKDNYSIAVPSLTGDITARPLTVNVSVTTKQYDGTNTATLTRTSDNRVAGDVLTISLGSGQFQQITPGSAIPVTAGTVTVTGTDASNYVATIQSGISGRIDPKMLTISGTFQVTTKDYDRTTAATGNTSGLTLVGVIGSETVSLDQVTLRFASANAGTHTVTITQATLQGDDSGNYSVSVAGSPTSSGTIDPLLRTVSATNTNKVYDGTTSASPTLAITPLAGDSALVTGTSAYDDANVADGIGISVTGISVNNSNYTVAPTLATTGNITPKTLTITGLTGDDKTYDATPNATVSGTPTLTGIVAADAGDTPLVGLDPNQAPTLTFADKNAASNKPITVTGYALTGSSASNYTLTSPSTLTATISPLQITPTVEADDKVYDGTDSATVRLSVTPLTIDNVTDDLTVSFSDASFSDRNVAGTGATPDPKTVTITGITLGGAEAANYTTSQTATTSATITRRTLTINAPTRRYNGDTEGTIAFSTNRISHFNEDLGENVIDDVRVITQGTFDTADVGSGKTVTFTITDDNVIGADKNNYTWTLPTSPATGSITKKILTVSGLSASDKVYDSTTAATVTGTPQLVGVIGDETVTLSGGGTFVFAQQSVGVDIRVDLASGSDFVLGGADADKYSLTQPHFFADITTRELTIGGTFTAADKVYNRTNAASFAAGGNSLTLVGVQGSDSLTLGTPTLRFANELADTGKTVSITAATFTSSPSDVATNYTLSLAGAPTATADISPKPLTVSAAAANKVYDQTTTGTLSSLSYTGRVSGDTSPQVVLSASSVTFDTASVGTGKTVTIALSLAGSRSSNYSIPETITRTANITAKALTINPTSVTGNNKVYDQTNVATVTEAVGGPELVGVISGDTVTIVDQTRNHTFTSVTVGDNKVITATGYAIEGLHAGNYSLAQPTFLRANITPKTVTATLTASSRVYNATTSATSTLSLSGVIDGDSVGVSGSVAFDNKNVGTAKTVTASSLALTGTHRANYTLSGVTSVTTTADITPFRLTITPSAADKVYDGTTTATATCTSNKIGADNVTADCGTAAFDTKDVSGTGSTPDAKTVTITGVSLTGLDAGNYLLPLDTDGVSEKTQYDTTATITRRALKASGFTPNDRDYDGTRDATFSIDNLTLGPLVDGGVGIVSGDENDVVFSNPAGRFDSRNAGTQNVRLQSWTLTGSASNNYTLDVAASLTQAVIRPINLTVTMTASNKVYNGNTNATVTAQIDASGLVGGDTTANISVSTPSGTFDTKDVGTGKTVTVDPASVTFSGSLAGNYVPVFTNPTANITARTLVWTVSATSRPYDGTTDVTYTLSDNRVSGDTFTVDPGAGSFATPTRANSKTVTVTGISISGGDAANYTVPATATGSANITPRVISVSGTFTAADKVYDRSTAATVTDTSTLVLGNLVAADAPGITINTSTAAFQTRNAGNGITVTLTGLTIQGANSTNYSVNVAGVTATAANITPRELTPTIVAANKRWDGTTTATLTSITVTPLAGDTVTVSASTATFDTADQGTGKTVTVSGISLGGAQAANYTVASTATVLANITGQGLTVSITATDKVYDGTRSATATLSDNRDVGDDITISHSPALFATPAAGNGITVTITNITITGPDADKYVLANVGNAASTSANITKKPLGITASSKVYDQSDAASIALDGVVQGDTVTFTSTSATFADKNVGTGKTVTATGLALGGISANNYQINAQETTTADITPRPLTLTFTPDPPVNDVAAGITVTIGDNRITGDDLTVTITDASTIRRGNQLVLVITGVNLTGPDGTNYITTGPYERVLRIFPAPERPRPTVQETPEDTTAVAPPVTTTPGTRPPGTTETTQGPSPAPTQPAPTAPTSPAPGNTATGQAGSTPDILPGWRPPTSPRATIDFGDGVVSRDLPPREIAEQIRVEAPQVVAGEQFAGFAPGARTQLEIMGARTISEITVPQSGTLTIPQLQQTFQNATLDVAPDAPRVLPAASPNGFETPTPEELELLQDALAWLGLPEATRGPGLAPGSAIGEVVWAVEGFRPSSAVFLVATSEPSLVAWGIAGEDGAVSLRGYVLDNTLPPGDHRFRVVGTSVIDEVPADESGATTIGRDLDEYLAIFDDDTRVSVALWGENAEGADHVAVRYIDPSLATPGPLWWWLLLPAALWMVIVLGRRRQGQWNEPGPTAGAVAIGAVLIAPAAVVGSLIADQELLVPWSVGVGAGVTLALLTIRKRRSAAGRARPRVSSPSRNPQTA